MRAAGGWPRPVPRRRPILYRLLRMDPKDRAASSRLVSMVMLYSVLPGVVLGYAIYQMLSPFINYNQ